MKKKYGSYALVFILAALAVAAVALFRKKSGPAATNDDSRNFAYKDTASITKIFIADKEGDACTISRTKQGWMVNGKYRARSEAILNLLEAIKNVEVKMPVSKEARQNVLKYMSTRALKVEVYTDGELVKQYYVGQETEDSEASYMLLTDIESEKNYDDPYACFIPGFKGFLHPRYIAKENEWRDRIVMNYIPPQIKEINVTLYDQPADSSFNIVLYDAKTFGLKNSLGQDLPFDEARLKQYLVYFQNISYERLISRANKKLEDSLSKTQPFCVITISTHDKAKEAFRFYRKKFSGKFSPELGVEYRYDPDRLYMNFADGREWAVSQYFAMGKLFITRNYFVSQAAVKK